MPTPVRLVEHKHRRLVMEARPDWGVVGCGGVFLFLAFTLTCWAIENGLGLMPLTDSCYLLLLDFVLIYMGVYGLVLPLGTAQELTLDKNMNSVVVKTPGLLGYKLDRYRLSDVLKLHHNRVDDGTFDKHALLLIFKHGGALQFPLGGGHPKTMALLADIVTKFLGVNRSDAEPVITAAPIPQRKSARVTVRWEPIGIQEERVGTAPLG